MEGALLNPYTRALQTAFSQMPPGQTRLDPSKEQFLANMIQGRFLQYMVTRLAQHYQITDPALEKELTLVVTNLLKNKFFNVFREKVQENPSILLEIGQKILDAEIIKHYKGKKLEMLFIWLGNQYFGYQNFEILFRWLNRNPEVEKIIFFSRLQTLVPDAECHRTMRFILAEDKLGLVPEVFNRYLEKGRTEWIKRLVKTGDWRLEAELVKEDLKRKVNWQRFAQSF